MNLLQKVYNAVASMQDALKNCHYKELAANQD